MKKILLITALLLSTLNATNLMGGGNYPLDTFNTTNQDINEKKKSYTELISFLKNSNNGEYIMYLAVLYLNGSNHPDEEGNIVEKDIEKSIYYFEKSIKLEYFNASSILGSLYLYNNDFMILPDNIKKAKFYLELALEKEIYDATIALSTIYLYYDNEIDKGIDVLLVGAAKGVSTAQLGLATLFANGSKDLNIVKNLPLANKYLTMACLNEKQTKKVKEYCSSKKVKKKR